MWLYRFNSKANIFEAIEKILLSLFCMRSLSLEPYLIIACVAVFEAIIIYYFCSKRYYINISSQKVFIMKHLYVSICFFVSLAFYITGTVTRELNVITVMLLCNILCIFCFSMGFEKLHFCVYPDSWKDVIVISHILIESSYKLTHWPEKSKIEKLKLCCYYRLHSQKCVNPNCLLNIYFKDIGIVITNTKEIQSFISMLCSVMISECPSQYREITTSFHFNASIFYASMLNDIHNAKMQISKLDEEALSFEEAYQLYRMQKCITSCYKKSNGEVKDEHKQYASFELLSKFEKFKKMLLKQSMMHCSFWSIISDESPIMSKLLDNGKKMIENLVKIENSWTFFIETYPFFSPIYRLYSVFQNEILGDHSYTTQIEASATEAIGIKSDWQIGNSTDISNRGLGYISIMTDIVIALSSFTKEKLIT